MKNIYDTKMGMSDLASSAFFSLTQAEYAAGNSGAVVVQYSLTSSSCACFNQQAILEAKC